MGNCQCTPKKGGESLKEFLTRKFHQLAKKRKIDDLVTIAIDTETKQGADGVGEPVDELLDIELLDLEDGNLCEGNEGLDIDVNTFAQGTQEIYRTYDDLTESDNKGCDVPSTRGQVSEENTVLRTLQKQLQEVQAELDNLQRDGTSRAQRTGRDTEQDGSYSVRSVNIRKPGTADDMTNQVNRETCSGQRTQRHNFLQAQGDVSDRTTARTGLPVRGSTVSSVENETARSKVATDRADTGGVEVKSRVTKTDGRKSKMLGKITEGLRTRSDSKPTRNKVPETNKQTLQSKASAKVEQPPDSSNKADRIAALQKRDPKLARPDKGIVYPKTLANLSKSDKKYYVEQFLRSELFRQRCLRKYQGSKIWMNGLTPFQIWILEHEGTEEIEAVLNPFPKRENNAQAKVSCWRGNTPPPPPPQPQQQP